MSGETPRLRHWVFSGLAVVHLTMLVLFVWSGFAQSSPSTTASVVRTYRNFSGAFRDYAFFAPAVASDLRAGFILEYESGETRFLRFAADDREVAFRYNNIVAASMRDVRGRDLFAQSWAAFILGAHPDAVRASVITETFVVPSMAEYRAGERPDWTFVYVGRFERGVEAGDELRDR